MATVLKLDRNMRIIATNDLGLETVFDTHPSVGGEDTAATPMEIMLQAMAACTFMDVISILRKKRKEVKDLHIHLEGTRGDTHPKMYTKVHMVYELFSPNAELKDLERSVELSQAKYCGASAMFKAAGCDVSYECKVTKV
jgi:putative redox protein